MKRFLFLLTLAAATLSVPASCTTDDEDYEWDRIASHVPCFTGDADGASMLFVDLDHPSYVTIYQHVTDGRYFTGRSEDAPVISRNTGWDRYATEREKGFYQWCFTDGEPARTWYLNF